MPTEPIWSLVVAQVASALRQIRRTNSSGYWNDVGRVYEYLPDSWEDTDQPSLSVTYEGGERQYGAQSTRQVTEISRVVIDGRVKADSKSKASRQQKVMRLVGDIHRAIYASPNLGIARVKRVWFSEAPAIDHSGETADNEAVLFRYALLVECSYEDNAP